MERLSVITKKLADIKKDRHFQKNYRDLEMKQQLPFKKFSNTVIYLKAFRKKDGNSDAQKLNVIIL